MTADRTSDLGGYRRVVWSRGARSLVGSGPPDGHPQPAAPPRRCRRIRHRPDETLLRWPLPPGAEKYAAIDGKRMHRDVVAQALISRRYRDQGHPKFWGRIIGTSSDAESAEWLAGRFRAVGLSDVRIQPFDLAPQWMPQAWEVSVTVAGKTLKLESAQPNYASVPTPPGGLDLEAVYVGLGSEADYVGKDVRGKAVFVLHAGRPPAGSGLDGAGQAGRGQGRGRDLRGGHAARQHALPGLPVEYQDAGVHRRQRRRFRRARPDCRGAGRRRRA